MKTLAAVLICCALSGAVQAGSIDQIRLTSGEINAKDAGGAGAGTSGVAGLQSTVLVGDPTRPGLYTIRLSIPAHTTIQAHTHRDDRTATVISGTWYFGYGSVADAGSTKPLPAGSFYTEPGGTAHFALTKAEPVVVYVTGFGPTDTRYLNAASDPRAKGSAPGKEQ